MKRLIITYILAFYSVLTFSQSEKRFVFIEDSVIKEGMVFKCPYIFTEIGGKRLIGTSVDSVELISKFLKKHSDWVFEFSNHTDERGDSKLNIDLSESYILFVGDILFNQYSIPKEQLNLKGYGESILLIPTKRIASAKSKKEKEFLHSLNKRYELKALRKKDS